jgi:hypothetical protein
MNLRTTKKGDIIEVTNEKGKSKEFKVLEILDDGVRIYSDGNNLIIPFYHKELLSEFGYKEVPGFIRR